MTATFGHRSHRIRAVLLAVVWAVPGAWAVGHALDHSLHHESGAGTSQPDAHPFTPVLVDTHDHGHVHPELLPGAFNGRLPQPVAVAALTPAPEITPAAALSPGCTRTKPARAAPRTATASGPRAPPVA